MKESFYFSHDYTARNDTKITQMRSVYGAKGYGLYWMIIEMLYEETEHKINMQGRYVWNAFALQLNESASDVQAFVKDCIEEFKLFESDDNYFWSNSVNRRLKEREVRSQKARDSANSRWNMRTHSDRNANDKNRNAIKERKGEEIKEKESKENEIKGEEIKEDQFPLSLKDIIKIWNNNIHMITSIECEKLEDWANALSYDVINLAIQEAVFNNARSMSYIEAILRNWQQQGLNTVEAVNANKRDRQIKQEDKHGTYSGTDKKASKFDSINLEHLET